MINVVKKHLKNIPGWRTGRKFVVFESDDWGTVRTSSKKGLDALRGLGAEVDKCHYMQNDSLASESDLSFLFEVLSKVKDKENNPATITANCLVANPDFEKIRSSNFSSYYNEDFRITLKKYPKHLNAFKLWKEGMQQKVFRPQSHGREHLNIARWMNALRSDDIYTQTAFEYEIFGVSGHVVPNKRGSFLAAFDLAEGSNFIDNRSAIIKDGLNKFKEIFGYSSKSFIAPNYVWDDTVEQSICEEGVEFIQSSTAQQVSGVYGDSKKIIRHYMGQKNSNNQLYLMRNATFEPASNPNKDWVNTCLRDIKNAFLWRKPAIISTHRVNYIGFINPDNRDVNLRLFEELLNQIIKNWPNVEFVSSDELGQIINN